MDWWMALLVWLYIEMDVAVASHASTAGLSLQTLSDDSQIIFVDFRCFFFFFFKKKQHITCTENTNRLADDMPNQRTHRKMFGLWEMHGPSAATCDTDWS
jgi:hypothetical protein